MVSSITEKNSLQLLCVWQQKGHANTQRSIEEKKSESIRKSKEVDLHKLNDTIEEIKQSVSGFPSLTGSETKLVR